MSRYRNDPELILLDPEAWDSPDHLSEDDLYAEAGADRPRGECRFNERGDEQ